MVLLEEEGRLMNREGPPRADVSPALTYSSRLRSSPHSCASEETRRVDRPTEYTWGAREGSSWTGQDLPCPLKPTLLLSYIKVFHFSNTWVGPGQKSPTAIAIDEWFWQMNIPESLFKPSDITQCLTIRALHTQIKIVPRGLSWAPRR